jgi:hypothetical protein
LIPLGQVKSVAEEVIPCASSVGSMHVVTGQSLRTGMEEIPNGCGISRIMRETRDIGTVSVAGLAATLLDRQTQSDSFLSVKADGCPRPRIWHHSASPLTEGVL